jgi:competence protein ComEA
MIKRLINKLEVFFEISRKEARAALVLMAFSICLLWFPFLFKRWILPYIPISSTPVDTIKLDSLAARLETDAEAQKNNFPFNKQKYAKAAPRSFKLFSFDPNRASTEQLEELGVPPFIAKRIDKYRSKGGQFQKKEDLLRIYDFPDDLYKRLEPYINLERVSLKRSDYANPDPKTAESFKRNTIKRETITYDKPALVAFDINTADTTQLIRLKGIGSKLSLRILKFRDGLGGFFSERQYAEIFGLDSLALSELNKYAKTITPVKKMHINSVTAEQLGSHSYLKNRKLVSVIINYRDQHGPYRSPDDLKKVRILDEKTIEKITPYLEF